MVDTHSLQSWGAMATKLSGKSDILIMKFGQWSSLTFLQYTYEQIDNLSKGVYTDMSNQIFFHNIGSIER